MAWRWGISSMSAWQSAQGRSACTVLANCAGSTYNETTRPRVEVPAAGIGMPAVGRLARMLALLLLGEGEDLLVLQRVFMAQLFLGDLAGQPDPGHGESGRVQVHVV